MTHHSVTVVAHRWTHATLVVGAILTLLPSLAKAEEPPASLPDIEDEVMCPICGTTLELSESPQAEQERALIRRLIEEGRTKEEIKNALVAEYGSEVLALPSDEGFDLTVWLIPPAAILLAAGAVAVGMWRQRRHPQAQSATDPPSQTDAERLERDRSSYDL